MAEDKPHRGVMPHEAVPKDWAPTWPVSPLYADELDIPGTYRTDSNPYDRPNCVGPITVLTRDQADRLLGRRIEGERGETWRGNL